MSPDWVIFCGNIVVLSGMLWATLHYYRYINVDKTTLWIRCIAWSSLFLCVAAFYEYSYSRPVTAALFLRTAGIADVFIVLAYGLMIFVYLHSFRQAENAAEDPMELSRKTFISSMNRLNFLIIISLAIALLILHFLA